MIKRIIFYLLCVMFLNSCKSGIHEYNAIDTTDILSKSLSYKKFRQNFTKNQDTIYLIKSKYYSSSWPTRVNTLNIKYLNEEHKLTEPNLPWNKANDLRLRCMITKLTLKNDSAKMGLIDFGNGTDYVYNLKKESGKWEVKECRILQQ